MKSRKYDITRSDELWSEAVKVIPMGTQTFSKCPDQFAEGISPKFIDRGEGCTVWDADGNAYIDYCMACQPIILGYCDPDVDAAIIEQLKKGILFSLPTELEIEVATRIIDLVPCAEAVRFGKNGADATSAAVRVSRAVTGRDHVAYCGYHGWHDWYIANTDLNSGIPEFNAALTHNFRYNDLASLEKIFANYPDSISCVIMEPIQVAEPAVGFLEGVRQLATDHGAILVFDEIITGFRFDEGGAQALTGVVPDLACFAKALSNGMPLSAITGRADIMAALKQTFFSFTYGGECLSLAAAAATIDKIRREKVVDHLRVVGERLKQGTNTLISEYGLEELVECAGYPCRTILAFKGNDRFSSSALKTFFQQEMGKRGILFAGYHALSYSHTPEVIDRTLEAYDDTLRTLREIVASNRTLEGALECPVIEPVFRRVADFMSQVSNMPPAGTSSS